MFSAEFMRQEVWHALSVHFPVALLPTATITLLIATFLKEPAGYNWQRAATMLLFSGSALAWLAIYTGNIADGVVARKICDPTVLKDHEISAEATAWLFSAAAVMLGLVMINVVAVRFRKIAVYLALGLMLAGTGYLVYAGHLGATLVYDQGAGVRGHVVDCNEYR